MASPTDWLPAGKSCAILLSVDDVHPSGSDNGVEAGGDLGDGMLGHLATLGTIHPELRVSLSVTPDWRARTPHPIRPWLPRTGWLANRFYHAPRWPSGTFRLDRHPAFVRHVSSLRGIEIVTHGLHHIRKGLPMPTEFAHASERASLAALRQANRIMRKAGLHPANGHVAPGWEAPAPFRRAMRRLGMTFIASARDIVTPIAADALTGMSGLHGQPLIYPGMTEESLVHIPANFQATSDLERALRILAAGGLLSIKAHAIKRIGNYEALDGLDERYAAYLDRILSACREQFGDAIWWASMGDIAAGAARPVLHPIAVGNAPLARFGKAGLSGEYE